MSPAQNLKDALNALDPTQPLTGTEEYYVPRGGGVDQLIENLRDDIRKSTKILFTGHRGSGKSTELSRLATLLNDTYFVAHFDVDSVLDVADVDYKDVLVSLGVNLYQCARQSKVNLDQKLLENLLAWFSTTLKEITDDTSVAVEAGAKVDTFFLRLASKLKAESQTRKTIRVQIESNLSDLIRRIDELSVEIQKKSGKPVLVVIDGLDRMMRLEKALEMFYQNTALILPVCKVVYTVPLAIFYSNEMGQVRATFDDFYALPNLKPFDRNEKPNIEGQSILKNIVLHRMSQSLISTDALTRLTELSGGLPRELISLTRDSVANARASKKEQINIEHVEMAAYKVCNLYRGMLTNDDLKELKARRVDKRMMNSAATQRLLHNLSLLEYRNKESWCNTHPLLWQLLDEST